MPTDTDNTSVPDPRDALIEKLKQDNANLEQENDGLAESLNAAREELKAAKAKQPQRDTVPAGDYCVLGGKTYQVAGTVPCKFATDEGRKGNIDFDSDLVVLKR